MTTMPTRSELLALLEVQGGPCISLYMPAGRPGEEAQQNPLRLRNLIQEAESHLLLNDLPITQIETLLKPVRALLDQETFWPYPQDGLAIFRSPDFFRSYWLPGRYQEQAVVTGHFYLKPLLPLLTGDGRLSLRKRQEEAARYRELAVTGRATRSLRTIVPAAFDGRIESLFLQADQEQWGSFNPATRALHIHVPPRFNDDDLLDVAASQTLLHGGAVYIVERADMPDEGPLAAVLRD